MTDVILDRENPICRCNHEQPQRVLLLLFNQFCHTFIFIKYPAGRRRRDAWAISSISGFRESAVFDAAVPATPLRLYRTLQKMKVIDSARSGIERNHSNGNFQSAGNGFCHSLDFGDYGMIARLVLTVLYVTAILPVSVSI